MHNRFVPIPGFPNYLINNEGKIWSIPRKKFLSHRIEADGHHAVMLGNRLKRYNKYVHRLVLETFVSSCPESLVCRHLDGNPHNNSLNNLCWGTLSENQLDSVKHGTHKLSKKNENHPAVKYSDSFVKEVVNYYKNHRLTQKEVAAIFGITQQTVSDWTNGRRRDYLLYTMSS